MHLSPAHSGCQAYECHVTERLNRDALSLSCSVELTAEEQARVIAYIMKTSVASRLK